MTPFRSILIAAAGGAALAACTPQSGEDVSGRALYTDLCAACHGAGGRGDGPVAAGLATPPPDLTLLSQRNGGAFPLVAVMSQIDGYTRTQAGDPMPDFGSLLDGPLIPVDTGDGVLTPTPVPLFAVAEYLRSLQR
jgi:mono/diheme cytochrome c family protein